MTPHLRPTFPSARFAQILIVGLGAAASASAQGSHSARFETRNASRMLVGSADADRDGTVSAEERSAYLDAITSASGETKEFSRDSFLANSLWAFYDENGNKSLDLADMGTLLGRWDTDGSGDISAAERSSGPRPYVLLDGIVLKALDINQDQAVTAEEWVASSSLDLSAWITKSASIQEDINGFGPGTAILTLRASLDADQNGRFDRADVVQHFSTLDANSDGVVDATELAPAQRRRPTRRQYTTEELNRKPAMPWQRSLEDALELSKQTGKPMLICVNADGESASDRLARGQYADPDFIKLARGFIPVLASPFPHTQGSAGRVGERLECPRFGKLVCTEHINGEPELFRRYFANQRVAPRHVGVTPEGEILFDLYLLQDLGVISRTLEKHGKFDNELPDPAKATDGELLDSRDAAAREELRHRFQRGDAGYREAMMRLATLWSNETGHPEILSLGLYDSNESVRKAAASEVIDMMSLDTVNFAPRVRWIAHNDAGLRQKLIVRLWTLVDSAPTDAQKVRPRRLARVYSALEENAALDAVAWQLGLAGAPTTVAHAGANDGPDLESALERISALLGESPKDPALNAVLAQTALRMAMRAIGGEGGGSPQYLLQDAEVAAKNALEVQPNNVLARSVLARAQWWSSQPGEAATSASLALPALTALAGSPEVAELLDILAKGRERTLLPMFGKSASWSTNELTESVAARRIQVAHPLATVEQVIAGISWFGEIEDYRGQADLILQGILRFPTSNDLHAWLRWQVLRDGSDDSSAAAALESAYAQLDTPTGFEPTWLWYKGLGLRTAGDTYLEQGLREKAAAAYNSCIASFEESISWNANFTDSATEHINKARAALAAL
jgi:hypothetical protein